MLTSFMLVTVDTEMLTSIMLVTVDTEGLTTIMLVTAEGGLDVPTVFRGGIEYNVFLEILS